jgi:hypothetical protein
MYERRALHANPDPTTVDTLEKDGRQAKYLVRIPAAA